jgi:hypothetical protein
MVINKNIVLFFILVLLSSCDTEPIVETSDNALPGLFSVSPTEQVRLSPGTLQYQASTDTWRFALNQYDVVGANNANISASNEDWIDLFGWATSGYAGCEPYLTSTDASLYGIDESIDSTNYDWGIYNAISNGGNSAGMWRLLSSDEWGYLLYERTGASDLLGVGCVAGVNGLILLSDDFVLPDSLEFRHAVASDSGEDLYRMVNDYTAVEWARMEAAGAVFFPAAGARIGKKVMYTAIAGYYWSSTPFEYDMLSIYCMGFDSSRAVWEGLSNRTNGRSVRLVKRSSF